MLVKATVREMVPRLDHLMGLRLEGSQLEASGCQGYEFTKPRFVKFVLCPTWQRDPVPSAKKRHWSCFR